MRVQRWVLGMSLTLLAISLVGLLVLPCIYVDEGSRASLLGLLTGMASGSLLAVVSTACGLRIAVSRSKRRLEYLCATLVSNLYGADLIFSKIGNGALPLRIITYAFDCLTGSGIACANAMCAEVDEDLFIMKKKRGQLGELLSIASALGPRATRLSNRGADVLRLESEVQKLSFSEKASASDALGSLRNALEKCVRGIFHPVASGFSG